MRLLQSQRSFEEDISSIYVIINLLKEMYEFCNHAWAMNDMSRKFHASFFEIVSRRSTIIHSISLCDLVLFGVSDLVFDQD